MSTRSAHFSTFGAATETEIRPLLPYLFAYQTDRWYDSAVRQWWVSRLGTTHADAVVTNAPITTVNCVDSVRCNACCVMATECRMLLISAVSARTVSSIISASVTDTMTCCHLITSVLVSNTSVTRRPISHHEAL